MSSSPAATENILHGLPSGVLSLVGGGGKTSLMFHLARLLSEKGARVLTTTTTKIFVPTASQSETVLVDPEPGSILRLAAPLLKNGGHVTAAAATLEGGKLKGFEPEAIGTFEDSGVFDWIMVEADGSARRPLKAPAEHEPVVPSNTSVLVAVAGLEVLGQPLGDERVFRPEIAAERMELQQGETITEAALVRLFAHPLGSFKGAPAQAVRIIFLNKGDDRERREKGERIVSLLKQFPRPVAETLIVGQALESLLIHATYSLREGS